MKNFYDTGKVKIGSTYVQKQQDTTFSDPELWQKIVMSQSEISFLEKLDYWRVPGIIAIGVALLFINLMV